jgi:hypothetical protein
MLQSLICNRYSSIHTMANMDGDSMSQVGQLRHSHVLPNRMRLIQRSRLRRGYQARYQL